MNFYDVSSEKSIINSMLFIDNHRTYALTTLKQHEFFDTNCKTLFQTIANCMGANFDIIKVFEKVKVINDKIKYSDYTQTDASYNQGSFKGLCDKIKKLYILRENRKIMIEIYEKYQSTVDYDSLIAFQETGLSKLKKLEQEVKPSSLHNIAMSILKNLDVVHSGNTEYIRTGYSGLDGLINGYRKGQLIILAARPSMGKTQFAMSLGKNICFNHPVDFYSFEMSENQLGMRLMSSDNNIRFQDLQNARITDTQTEAITKYAFDLNKAKFIVNDVSGMDIDTLIYRIKANQLTHKTKLVIIDHLGFITVKDSNHHSSRNHQIGIITKKLKAVSKELGLTVILLCQLNREVEARSDKDKQPKLSDLRDSGEIEQDADIVLMLHREDYYKQFDPNYQADNRCDCLVRKNRDGRLGTVNFIFQKDIMRFTELVDHSKQMEKEF